MNVNFLRNRSIIELNSVIVFGAGYFGIMTIYFCKKSGIKVISCMDNNVDRQDRILLNCVPCKKTYFEKDVPVIISLKNDELAKELLEQCKKLGYTDIIRVDHDKLESEYNKLPDKDFNELRYAMFFEGELPDCDNPRTYNEKLQWLKLYDRKNAYTIMADKYEVKKYIANKIGEKYLIPTLGIWSRFDEINFDNLPNQFVLKCTHDSGSVIVVQDKGTFDVKQAKEKLEKSLNKNFYNESREWAYKNIPPRIIAEEYMICNNAIHGIIGILDYKIHCFNGEPKYIQVIGNRELASHAGRQLIYDFEWKKQEWSFGDYPKYEVDIPRPHNLKLMYEHSKSLAKNIKYVRIDWYEIDKQLKFGEITFIPNSGLYVYNDDWTRDIDRELGDLIKLD